MSLAKVLRAAWFWYLVALLVIVLDQWSKTWINHHLTFGVPVEFTSYFNFTLYYNHGAAFSFLSDAGGWQRWFFALIALVVSAFLIYRIAQIAASKPLEAFAMAFILGGALGNLYDRIVLGRVIDFIVVHYHDHYWPAFNLADSAITFGVFVLVMDMLFMQEKEKYA